MTEDDNNTVDEEETTGDSEANQNELTEALDEGILQKSAEVSDEKNSPDTSEYEDGYIPTRFRDDSRSTGERRARQDGDTSDE
jgi:hypothetical protein